MSGSWQSMFFSHSFTFSSILFSVNNSPFFPAFSHSHFSCACIIYVFSYGPGLWVIPLWYFIFLTRNWKGGCETRGDRVEDCVITGGQTSPQLSLSLYPILPGLSLATAEARWHDAWIHRHDFPFSFFVVCFQEHTVLEHLLMRVIQLQVMVHLLVLILGMCFDATVVTLSSLRYSTPANISTLVSLIIFLNC